MTKKAHFYHYSTHIDRFITLQYQIKKKSISNTILEVGSSDLPLQIEGYILLQCVAGKHGQYMMHPYVQMLTTILDSRALRMKFNCQNKQDLLVWREFLPLVGPTCYA